MELHQFTQEIVGSTLTYPEVESRLREKYPCLKYCWRGNDLIVDQTTFRRILSIWQAEIDQVTIRRDQNQIPTFRGDNLKGIYYLVAYTQVMDRPYQNFISLMQNLGKLATIPAISTGGIQNDEAVARSQLEVDPCWDESFRCLMEGYTEGLNAAYLKLNQTGIPATIQALGVTSLDDYFPISLEQLIQAAYQLLAPFSSARLSIRNQLENLTQFSQLLSEGYTVTEATNILKDVSSNSGNQSKSCFYVTQDGKATPYRGNTSPCHYLPPANAEISRLLISPALQQLTREKATTSYGAVFSKKLTETRENYLVGGPQFDPSVPSPVYRYNIEMPTRKWNAAALPHWPLLPHGRYSNQGYQVTLTPQNTTPSSADLLILPVRYLGAPLYYQTIQVFGATNVEIPIYRSPVPGQVIQISGDYALIERTPFLINRSRYLTSVYPKIFFSSCFEQFWKDLTDAKNNSDLSSALLGFDSADNIFAIQLGAWSLLPSKYNRNLPQGLTHQGQLVTPIPPQAEYCLFNGYAEANPKQGYFVHWNNAFAEFQPNVFRQGAWARVAWLNLFIEKKLAQGCLAFGDLNQFHLWVANARGLSQINPTDSSANPIYFFQKYFPAPEKIEQYLGETFGINNGYQILTNENYLENWALTMTWLATLQELIFLPILKSAYPYGNEANLPWGRGDDSLVGPLMQIFQVTPCAKSLPLHFEGWTNRLELLADEAYVLALARLNEYQSREAPVFNYTLPLLNIPVASSRETNRATSYLTATSNHLATINSLGQKESFNQFLQPGPETVLYQEAYEQINLQSMP